MNCEFFFVDVVLSPDPNVFKHTNALAGLKKDGCFIIQSDKATAQEVWEYPISTLSGDKTTMGYWVTRKLLSIARYLGLKKHD